MNKARQHGGVFCVQCQVAKKREWGFEWRRWFLKSWVSGLFSHIALLFVFVEYAFFVVLCSRCLNNLTRLVGMFTALFSPLEEAWYRTKRFAGRVWNRLVRVVTSIPMLTASGTLPIS